MAAGPAACDDLKGPELVGAGAQEAAMLIWTTRAFPATTRPSPGTGVVIEPSG